MTNPKMDLSSLLEQFEQAVEPLRFIRISKTLPETTFESSQLKLSFAYTRLIRWAYFIKLHDDHLFAITTVQKDKLREPLKLLNHLTTLGRKTSEYEHGDQTPRFFAPGEMKHTPRLIYQRLLPNRNIRIVFPRRETGMYEKWSVGSKSELDELHRKIAILTDRLEKVVPVAVGELGDYAEDAKGRAEMLEASRKGLRKLAEEDLKRVLTVPREAWGREGIDETRVWVANIVRDEAEGVDPHLYHEAKEFLGRVKEGGDGFAVMVNGEVGGGVMQTESDISD